MKSAYTIIDSLVLSEKSSRGMEHHAQYTFRVNLAANKLEIKKAVEELFHVHVTKVNTLHRKGKRKRERTMTYGQTSSAKRAIVTLRAGEKIEVV